MGVEPAEIRRRVDEALKAVGMYEYRESAPHQLSGGQKQRVAIAGIIAMQPRCILLDEPTAMLDPRGRQEVMRVLRQLNREKGITVVLITHYMEEAAACDRVIVMDDGHVLMDDVPRKVFSHVAGGTGCAPDHRADDDTEGSRPAGAGRYHRRAGVHRSAGSPADPLREEPCQICLSSKPSI